MLREVEGFLGLAPPLWAPTRKPGEPQMRGQDHSPEGTAVDSRRLQPPERGAHTAQSQRDGRNPWETTRRTCLPSLRDCPTSGAGVRRLKPPATRSAPFGSKRSKRPPFCPPICGATRSAPKGWQFCASLPPRRGWTFAGSFPAAHAAGKVLSLVRSWHSWSGTRAIPWPRAGHIAPRSSASIARPCRRGRACRASPRRSSRR